MTESKQTPDLSPRPIPRVVASCFYANLEVGDEIERNPTVAWQNWRATYAKPPGAVYEEPELIKAREDLAALGQAAFEVHWAFLCAVMDAGQPGELLGVMRAQMGAQVAEGYERRSRRTGRA